MTAVAAFFAHSEGADRESDVVADNKDVLHRDFFLCRPVFHGFAGEVHICRGFDHNHLATFVFHLRHHRQSAGGEGAFEVFRQMVGDHETDVMPRVGVLGSYIS